MWRLPSVRLIRRKLGRVGLIVDAAVVVLTVIAISACVFFGIRGKNDVYAYHAMLRGNFHPLWKDLAWRRIGKGDAMGSVVRKHRPLYREEYGRYTYLGYQPRGSFDALGLIAKDGQLIHARAGSCCWEHIFFDTPEEEQSLRQAYAAYGRQLRLESQAYSIHRAVAQGQDVFVSECVECTRVLYEPDCPDKMLSEMEELYGLVYLKQIFGPDYPKRTRREYAAEVTKVLHGDLEVGTILRFSENECGGFDPNQSGIIFLRFEDSRMIYRHSQGGERYVTVPKHILEWYQSLTKEQVDDMVARCQSRSRAYRARLD